MTGVLKAIKEKSQVAWASGHYTVIGGAMLAPVSEALCEAAGLPSDSRW